MTGLAMAAASVLAVDTQTLAAVFQAAPFVWATVAAVMISAGVVASFGDLSRAAFLRVSNTTHRVRHRAFQREMLASL